MNEATEHLNNPLANLRLNDVVEYLKKTRWKSKSSSNGFLSVFAGPKDDSGRPIEVVLPKDGSEDGDDTKLRISQAVNLLSVVEDRSFDEIVFSILHRDRDVIRDRVMGEISTDGTLPLEAATKRVQGYLDLIRYSASMEEDPRPFFPRALGSGVEMVKQARFGQTFVGSYGFTIEMNIPTPSEDGLFPDAPFEPMERKIVERIARGLKSAQEATEQKSPDPIVQNYRKGFNANLCDAMLNIAESSQGCPSEFSFSWALGLSPSSDVANANVFRIEPKTYEYISEAAQIFRTIPTSTQTTVVGFITGLKDESRGNPDARLFENRDKALPFVVIKWEGHKNRHIRFSLDEKTYLKACDAHKDGRPIEVMGTPERKGNIWTLLNPSGFTVL